MSTATLTARQEQFAHHYSANHNAADAARRAGYASGRANRTGYELLQKPLVLAMVKELDAEKRAEGRGARSTTLRGPGRATK